MPPAKKTSSPASAKVTDTTEIMRIRGALAWRPMPGDMIDGKVIKMLARDSDFGIYPVMVMDIGEIQYTAVHAFHTILRDGLRELRVKSGDDVVVMYQGKIQSNKPYGQDAETGEDLYREYHSYVVIGNGVDSTVEFTWDMEPDMEPDMMNEPDLTA